MPWKFGSRASWVLSSIRCSKLTAWRNLYNHWSSMPTLADQHSRMGSFTAPFTVLRLLTPLKMTYEAAKKRAEPYNKIVEELPEMKRETVELVKNPSPKTGAPMCWLTIARKTMRRLPFKRSAINSAEIVIPEAMSRAQASGYGVTVHVRRDSRRRKSLIKIGIPVLRCTCPRREWTVHRGQHRKSVGCETQYKHEQRD